MPREMPLKKISELRASKCTTTIRDHQGWCGTAGMEGTPRNGAQGGAGMPQGGQGDGEESSPGKHPESKGVSPGSKGAVTQQAGKRLPDSLPTNAEVIHVQTNNSSINNTAALTS